MAGIESPYNRDAYNPTVRLYAEDIANKVVTLAGTTLPDPQLQNLVKEYKSYKEKLEGTDMLELRERDSKKVWPRGKQFESALDRLVQDNAKALKLLDSIRRLSAAK